MKRFIPKIVFCGLVTACLFAISPTRFSFAFDSATIEGVVLAPSAFSTIVGSPPSTTAIAEFVVPKSIPNILPIDLHYGYNLINL